MNESRPREDPTIEEGYIGSDDCQEWHEISYAVLTGFDVVVLLDCAIHDRCSVDGGSDGRNLDHGYGPRHDHLRSFPREQPPNSFYLSRMRRATSVRSIQ